MESASASRAASAGSASDSGSSIASLQVGETCSYLAPDPFTGCREARTCESCLQTVGCMINDSGLCVDKYVDPTEDYRIAIGEGLVLPNASANYTVLYSTQRWEFPSGSIRYCNTSDSVCRSCTRNNFWRSRNTYPDSRFCLGEDNACVCIDVCERRWFVTEDCSSSSGYAPSPGNSPYFVSDLSIGQRLWHAVVGAIVFVVVVLVIMVRSRRASQQSNREQQEERQRRQDAQRERRNARAATLGVNPLSLSGWETHRRDLISKEMAQLSGAGDVKTFGISEQSVERGDHSNDSTLHDGGDSVYVRMEDVSEPQVATTTAGFEAVTDPSSTATSATLPSLAPVTSTRHHRSSR